MASGVNGGLDIAPIVKPFALISAPVEAQQPDRRWIILAVFAALAVIVVGVILISRSGGDDDGDTTSASGGSKGGCQTVEASGPEDRPAFTKPGQVVEKGEKVNAVVKTSCGEFTIALDTERAPKTSNSFAFLAEEGFFDETTFHRIVPEFVIQGGDPEGTGSGGPGYSVVEAPPSNLEYTKGIVAMAKTETEAPGTSGSQFYVVTGANVGLPPEYALLGEVTAGYPTVEKIEKQAKPGTEEPKQPVVIESVTIEKE